MSTPQYRGLGDIIVTARPFDEYVAMFDLREPDLLAGAVLDCPAGASGFAAGARALGADVTATDPAYALPHADLVARARHDTAFGNQYVADHPDVYEWGFFRDLPDHLARRMAAVAAFDADRTANPARYINASLPDLPFADGTFNLVVSSHLLFVYPDHFSYADHLACISELVRVTAPGGEARIFPLVDTTTEPWPDLDRLRRELGQAGHASEVRTVPYEFIRRGTQMLVVDGSATAQA